MYRRAGHRDASEAEARYADDMQNWKQRTPAVQSFRSPQNNPRSQLLVRIPHFLNILGRNKLIIVIIRGRSWPAGRIRIVGSLCLAVTIDVSDLPDIAATVLEHDFAPLALFAAAAVGTAAATATT